MPKERSYTAHEASALAHVSYRQLDYWDRSRLLQPSVTRAAGSGSQRLYSEDDLEKLQLIKALLDAGIGLSRLRIDGDPRKTAARLATVLQGILEEPA
jgi:DNA-binding transcriptional MerR regulator